jgi:hypothetical protein
LSNGREDHHQQQQQQQQQQDNHASAMALRAIVNSTQRTIVDSKRTLLMKKDIAFALSQIQFMRLEGTKRRNRSVASPLNPMSCSSLCLVYLSLAVMVTFDGIHFNSFVSGQTGFYSGNFSLQEQALAWKRTSETYLLTPIPQT